jgi:eukaryotic-like serine/threonine-protein kinase
LALMEEFGLVGQNLGSEPSQEFESGTVIRQSPEDGTLVAEGDQVTYVLSTGADLVAVPNVVCLTFDEAAGRLDDRGLTLEFVDDPTENLACPDPDRVAAQSPEAGEEVEQGSTVEVRPALPPPTTIEPTPTESETG